MLARDGVCQVKTAPSPHLLIELDSGRQGAELVLDPETPLALRW